MTTDRSSIPAAQRGSWPGRLAPLIAALLAFGALAALVPAGPMPATFLEWENVHHLLAEAVVLTVAALGLMLVMAMGGIDLSVGAVMGLAMIVTAQVLMAEVGEGDLAIARTEHRPLSWPVLAITLGVLAGGACGLVNGVLIVALRAPAYLVTLVTLMLARGAAMGLSRGRTIYPSLTWVDQIMEMLFPGACVALALAGLIAWRLWRSKKGRDVIAVGEDEDAARQRGVRVGRLRVRVYTLAGLLAGLAGVLLFSLESSAAPAGMHGRELEIIAAVLIGGASLRGGRASVIGAFGGVLLVVVIGNGLEQVGAAEWLRLTAAAAIVVIALAVDRWRRRETANHPHHAT